MMNLVGIHVLMCTASHNLLPMHGVYVLFDTNDSSLRACILSIRLMLECSPN
jgi:hypothetical protein